MAIQFRCPHRPWRVPQDKSRNEKAIARRTSYDVPAGTEWVEVKEEYSAAKAGHPRYADDAPSHWEAEVTCPDCGDTICITSGANPGQTSEA